MHPPVLRVICAICIAGFVLAGCAHHHDAAADDSENQAHAHHKHGMGTENDKPHNPSLGGF